MKQFVILTRLRNKISRRRANFVGTKNCGGEKRSGESEGGQKFLPPNPLPFCPPERSVSVLPREAWQSEIAVRIFVKKSSDFNQKAPPIFRIRILGDCLLRLP